MDERGAVRAGGGLGVVCLAAFGLLACGQGDGAGAMAAAGGAQGDGGASGAGGSGGDGNGDTSGATGGMPGGGGGETDPRTPLADLPERCRGFEVLGLEHSPGGDTLPNTCAPFDTVYNNPYAVRCIEAEPTFDTGYPGDEFCILPPPPELGTQVRVGPDDYDDVPARFVMEPGEEFNDYYFVNAPNEQGHYFYRVNMRMRPGSHHMINRLLPEDQADGWAERGENSSGVGFPGAQRPDQDRPNGTLVVPPENAGLGQELLPHQQFSFNLHHFNLSSGQTLREVWVNIWYKPEAEVVEPLGSVAIFGNPADLDIPPGERRVLHYKCEVEGDTRVITMNGHRHASTARFGAWLERADGETVSLYESFHYEDMPTYQFDSISENPKPDADAYIDGGYSGMLQLSAGDEVHFVCDVTNMGTERLRFANEVETGEMCILFGSRVGDPLCRLGTRVFD